MATADVGHRRPAGELGYDAVEGGQPVRDQVCVVGRREEAFAPHVHVGVVVAPTHAVTGACGVDDSVRVAHGSVRDLEESADERGAGFVGQRDGVFGWQFIPARRRVVVDEGSGRLRIEPFAGVVLIGAGAFGQFGRGAWPEIRQAAVVAETVTHHDQGAVQYGTDLPDRLEDERHQLSGSIAGAVVVLLMSCPFLCVSVPLRSPLVRPRPNQVPPLVFSPTIDRCWSVANPNSSGSRRWSPARGCGKAACWSSAGEAGIGKTALLEDTARKADEMQVLRASGSEFEAGLGFSGLHQLLLPTLGLLDHLPAQLRDALEVALTAAERSRAGALRGRGRCAESAEPMRRGSTAAPARRRRTPSGPATAETSVSSRAAWWPTRSRCSISCGPNPTRFSTRQVCRHWN